MASHGVARPTTLVSRTEQERLKEQYEIAEYLKLENSVRVEVADQRLTPELFDRTSILLKKNPEYYTVWNIRRRLLINCLFSKSHFQNGITKYCEQTPTEEASPALPVELQSEDQREYLDHVLELIRTDLKFLYPIMLKFPKCYWLWNHRSWLLEQANKRLSPSVSRELWSAELTLVGKLLVKDSRNFHGWGYRRTVVSQLESSRLKGTSMVESEFEYTTKIIHALNGLSNFSAWHRRSKLIPRLLMERNLDAASRRQFLDDEFDLIVSAMYTDSYPYQQSVWFYYQFLTAVLTEPDGCQVVEDFTIDERCKYVRQQLGILDDMLDGAEDCKWIYNAMIDFTFAICKLEDRDLLSEEKLQITMWLKELKNLDPYRKGRWNDLEMMVI